ncbi:F-box protein SKIP23-like [Panicum hallii]|uniref:F-box protein SKIP23-like n=1 Tax=Panicum hallii TaxID=206008 RepID=UPI000DF4D340|nr:F-box protein SKIP23-like [Panicum hallii]
MAQPLPDWSSMQKELLESIGKRLASGHDVASFRSACSPWRAAVPFATFGPLLLLPFDPDSDTVSFYCVSEKTAFSLTLPDVRGKVPCGSSCGWLVLMDEAASVTLLNPFTGARVGLPPADDHVAAASSWERASKVHGWWFLRSGNISGNALAANAIKLEEMRGVFFHEIVLSAPPDAGRECVAMAVLASSTEVAFCRTGVDSAWTLLDTKLECSVASIVHCQDKFLAIDVTGEISIVFSSNATDATPTATPLPSLSPPSGLCHRSYLESDGELHMVGAMVSTFHDTQEFTYRTMIYKCNLLDRAPEWTRVKDVGDLTLFVSKNFSESFSGTSVSKYKKNIIYFSEPLYGDPFDLAHRLEVADIAAGTSKVKKPFSEKMLGSEALGWIRPNLWKGVSGAIGKYDEKSQTEASPKVTDAPEPAAEVQDAGAVQFKST